MPEKITRRSFLKTSAVIGATSFIASDIVTNLALAEGEVDIAVVSGDDYFKNALAAVKQLGGIKRFVPEKSSVAVLANPQRNNPGAFTNPEVLRAVLRMCKNAGAKQVDCISLQSQKSWDNTGLAKVIKEEKANLPLVDRKDKTQFKTVPIPKGIALKEARIMNTFFEYDVFINVPVTKDHAGNKFTGAMKNLMGINSQQNNRTFHKKNWTTDINSIRHLDQCIADLNTIVKPDLCVVDATEFITTNGPFGPGKLAKPHKVVAGTDRVAIDSYCCTLWGLKGEDIIAITRAYEHGLGEMNLKKVKISELKLETTIKTLAPYK